MTRAIKTAGYAILALGSLFWIAGRNPSHLGAYFRASADETVNQLEKQIPDEVHDRKLDHELASLKTEVIERQVQLSQVKTQTTQLRDDVTRLEKTLATRKRLLAEAYPILQEAEKKQMQQVRFANADYKLIDFQLEIDDLMASQDSETKQLEIKRSGLARLEKSEQEAEIALNAMLQAIDSVEHEVAVLKSRREQAEIESKTLDMVSAVSDGVHSTTEGVGRSVERLKESVAKQEAVNEAKREMAPVTSHPSNNQLSRQWSRLEALEKYQDESTPPPTNDSSQPGDNSEPQNKS